MKESELIIMRKKIEQLGALMQGVLQELTNLRDLSVGTLQTIKNMPDYDEAIKKLEEQMKEKQEDVE
jgi:predicted ATP-grasp superfamily ATP-dependent carboligase|tara:strand:+ start:176 stop:376 length:201 start_codon:yes stop_codon:yes gene_type:complete